MEFLFLVLGQELLMVRSIGQGLPVAHHRHGGVGAGGGGGGRLRPRSALGMRAPGAKNNQDKYR